MNISGTPTNGFDVIRDIFNNRPPGSDADKLFNESEAISKLIQFDDINNAELANRLDSIKDCFLKCTKESANELTLEEKINLKHAFTDILDEVSLKMHQNANIRNSQSQGPTGLTPIDSQITLALYVGNLAFKAINYTANAVFSDGSSNTKAQATEEEVIKKVQNAFASIDRDQRFDRYETQFLDKKKMLSEVSLSNEIKYAFVNLFDIKKSAEDIAKIKEKENAVKLMDRCTVLKNTMEGQHIRKTQNLSITPPKFDWKNTFDPMIDQVYDALLEVEKSMIGKTLDPYTPQQIFHGKTFSEFLTSIIDQKISNSPGLTKTIGTAIVQDLRTRLANNLKLITEDYNLARFTINMNTDIAKVFSALDKLGPESTRDDLLASLGIMNTNGSPVTSEQYMKMAYENIIVELSRLCSLEQKDSSDTVEGFIKSNWTNIGNATSEKALELLIKTFFDFKDLQSFLGEIPQLPSNEKSDKINKNMDIIALFLINKLVTEMGTIASEARRAERKNLPTDVSGIADEKAMEEVKNSTLALTRALRNFTLPTEAEYSKNIKEKGMTSTLYEGLTNYLTFAFVDYVVDVQGGGSLKDIATPCYKEFVKKWTNWISQ